MNKVAVSTTEYKKLQRHSRAYQKLVGRLFESVLRDPVADVVADFRKTTLYSEAFLRDLETGLRRSSLGKKK